MRSFKFLRLAAGLALAIASSIGALAQAQNGPWVQMESMSFNLGIGGQSGDGLLHLPKSETTAAILSRSRVSGAAYKSAYQRSARPVRSRV